MIRNGRVDRSRLCGHSVHNANKKRKEDQQVKIYPFQYLRSLEGIHQGHMKNMRSNTIIY